MLQYLSGNIQRKIRTVHKALDEAEIVRNKIRTFFHDHDSVGIKGQSLFEVLGIIIVGRLLWYEHEGCV